jgi:uncharacterized membrane protein YidH (DUF202 family)
MPFLHLFRTPIYKNTGSVARDHLASERTFLSWIRSGLGFLALGIAIERFNQLDLSALSESSVPSSTSAPTSSSSVNSTSPQQDKNRNEDGKQHLLVGALLGTGSASIVYGTARYFSNLRMLERGLYKPAYFGAAGLSVAVAGLAGGVFVEATKMNDRRRRREGD